MLPEGSDDNQTRHELYKAVICRCWTAAGGGYEVGVRLVSIVVWVRIRYQTFVMKSR